jgi:hypothetical protein
MLTESVNLDLHELTPDQQVGRLKEQYVLLRGQGAVVRARMRELPVRQYISLLERGYRVALERDGESFVLVLRPDGSTPRLGLRGAHSVVSHPDGRVYTNTTENRVAVFDASTRRVKRHIPTGDEPSHLELSHDGKGFTSPTAVRTMSRLSIRRTTKCLRRLRREGVHCFRALPRMGKRFICPAVPTEM